MKKHTSQSLTNSRVGRKWSKKTTKNTQSKSVNTSIMSASKRHKEVLVS